MNERDCKVCRSVTKHKPPYGWITAFMIASIIATIFAVLYLGDGNIGGTTNIKIDNEIDGGSTNENNIVTGNNSTISGTIDYKSSSDLYLALSIIIGSTILTGGIIYGNKNRSRD